MPRGGRRTGTPGKAYAARTDLQAVKVAPSKQYGQAAAQAAAQRAVPLAGATSPGPMPTGGAPAAGAPAPRPMLGPMPGAVTPLDAPTQRPDEPLTAGMPMGPGAGSEANPFAQVGSPDDAALAIRAAYQAYPSEELRAILERLDLD